MQGPDGLRERTQGKNLREITLLTLAHSGLIEHYRADREGADRIENLEELVNAAESFVTQEGFGKDAVALPVDEQGAAAGGVPPVPDAETGEIMSPLAAFLTHAALEAGDNQAQAGQDAQVDVVTVTPQGEMYPNADLDVVVASVHSGFRQPEREMTERVVTAMHNDHVDIIGHPTGRILLAREPYRIDLAAVFEAAAALGVLLEIDAFPGRLDLSDVNARLARDAGARFSLGSDAHNRENLRYMEFGVATARRGWLTADDIANTRPLAGLRKLLTRR
mgnify:CR=1 FL=1